MTDFFIIGAAKSGTTTIDHWLRQQPGIALPRMKEPHYFCFAGHTPVSVGRGVDPWFARNMAFNPQQYAGMFATARRSDLLGDVSTGYLHFIRTAYAIRKHNPRARIVCILRNPADRAYSQFMHHRRDGYEPILEFADALDAESRRRAEGWWWGYHYRDAGLYHDRLKVYYDNFDARQILVLTQDNLKQSPRQAFRRIMHHVGAGEPSPVDYSSRRNRASTLSQMPRNFMVNHLFRPDSKIVKLIDSTIPPKAARAIKAKVKALNSVPTPCFPEKLRDELLGFYRKDILATQTLTGVQLDHWLEPVAQPSAREAGQRSTQINPACRQAPGRA